MSSATSSDAVRFLGLSAVTQMAGGEARFPLGILYPYTVDLQRACTSYDAMCQQYQIRRRSWPMKAREGEPLDASTRRERRWRHSSHRSPCSTVESHSLPDRLDRPSPPHTDEPKKRSPKRNLVVALRRLLSKADLGGATFVWVGSWGHVGPRSRAL